MQRTWTFSACSVRPRRSSAQDISGSVRIRGKSCSQRMVEMGSFADSLLCSVVEQKLPLRTANMLCHISRMLSVMRNKLSAGSSYPLKASVLEQAIVDRGIKTATTLFLHHGAFWAKRPLFYAKFYLVGALVKNETEEFWVSCRSVAADDNVRARNFIEDDAIPAFVKWAADLEALPLNSTRRVTQEIVRDWPTETGS